MLRVLAFAESEKTIAGLRKVGKTQNLLTAYKKCEKMKHCWGKTQHFCGRPKPPARISREAK